MWRSNRHLESGGGLGKGEVGTLGPQQCEDQPPDVHERRSQRLGVVP